jgi:DNA polymerase-3 subunit alpha
MYYKPRVDREVLAKYSKGIIVTTGCLSSPMNKNLLHGDREAAEEWVKFFIDNFEHVFVELQRNGVEESEKLIPTQIEIAKKYNLEMVATCDSHYINKADSDLQEINWCIRDANLLSDPDRAKKWGDEFYVKSNEEMVELAIDLYWNKYIPFAGLVMPDPSAFGLPDVWEADDCEARSVGVCGFHK